jgi:inner membrane transporter RhtA
MCLEPAIAVTVGLVLLGQVPRVWSLAGVAFVIAAGLGAERHGARTAPQTAAAGADDADMSALSGVIAPETADISGC